MSNTQVMDVLNIHKKTFVGQKFLYWGNSIVSFHVL